MPAFEQSVALELGTLRINQYEYAHDACCSLSLFLVVGPSSAEECAFLPAAKLDAAFPAQAPWSTLVGGAGGRCKFLSRSDQYPSTFSLTQVVQEDEAAAAAYTATLRVDEPTSRRLRWMRTGRMVA